MGDKLTIADLHLYVLCNWIGMGVLDGIPKSVITDQPCITALVKKINELIGMQPQVQDFFTNYYSTEIADLIPRRRFSILEAVDVWISFLGMLIKIVWAFLWQEQ